MEGRVRLLDTVGLQINQANAVVSMFDDGGLAPVALLTSQS